MSNVKNRDLSMIKKNIKDQIINIFGEDHSPTNIGQIPESADIAKIFGVDYLHYKLENGDDLYITKNGLPIIQNLIPENYWTDESWFRKNSIKLNGTSTVYKIKTKEVNNRSKDIVLKWNRMGQDIPGEEESEELMNVEFNSPFEEFSLLKELFNTRYESPGKIITQLPYGIYVPLKSAKLWQTGRKEYIMQTKIKTHFEIELDMHRTYAVIYGWIKGIDAVQAFEQGLLNKKEMEDLTLKVENDMRRKVFQVRDRKPDHIIVKPYRDGTLVKNRKGDILYAVIDYELLERTPEREKKINKDKRHQYLKKQVNRFDINIKEIKFPPNLYPVKIFGVDYVYGHSESTNGKLWVVGRDSKLFDYFLPERWESTPRTKLSISNEIYYTLTKDKIHLVWKVSNVGIQPDIDPYKEDERKILKYGYNSPFEEVSIAIELNKKGIRIVYPRAIYMTGSEVNIPESLTDTSRYKSHKHLITPDKIPVLKKDYNYIIIWGYWNGPIERLAVKDGDYYNGINALDAYRKKIITLNQYISLIKRKKEKLARVGIQDLNLRGNHLLLSLDQKGSLVTDNQNLPDVRICNFELLRKMK
ncbi:MAG: hypothetical protein KKH98_02435 [Spirochaetes bacterium]|nr:hypothetical protein [Spirochaetota bacterium]